MKKIFLYFVSVLAFGAFLWQGSQAQVMLQKAVVTNGGGTATNSLTNGMFVVGQTAAGTVTNSNTIGHFGFLTSVTAAASVNGAGAGSISSLRISPNPASSDVSVNVTLANAGNVELFLYDASGHKVSTIYSGTKEAGINTFHIDAASLSSGAYFVAAQVPGAMIQSKLNVIK